MQKRTYGHAQVILQARGYLSARWVPLPGLRQLWIDEDYDVVMAVEFLDDRALIVWGIWT